MRKIFWIFCTALLLTANSYAEIKPIEEIFEPDATLYPVDKFGKVAVIQWAPPGYAPLTQDEAIAESWKQRNRERIASYIDDAANNGAKMVLAPEFSTVGYPDIPELSEEDDNFTKPEEIAPYAEPIPGKTTDYFSKIAKKYSIYLHIGMAEENKISKSKTVFHNTVVVIGPDGEIVAKYSKMHLYQNESDYLVPGKDITIYNNKYFGRVGLVICSDVYGSHPMDNYAREKIDVLALSTSWAQYNTGWSYFTRGAQWVNAYLLAANQNYFPDSGVIEPSGKAQSHIRQTTGVAYGYLPLK